MYPTTHRSFVRQFAALTIIPALLLALTPYQARAADDVVRVVYHVDYAEPRRFSAMLTSINNMVMHYNNNFIDYDVRIVFVAHGIRFVTDNKLANTPFAEDKQLAEQRKNLRGRLTTLASMHNVKMELCDITRSEIGLDKAELYDGVSLVPSGVVRIAQLQGDKGFSYIKTE